MIQAPLPGEPQFMPNYPLFARDPFLDNIRREPAFVAFMEELQPQWKRLSLEFQ